MFSYLIVKIIYFFPPRTIYQTYFVDKIGRAVHSHGSIFVAPYIKITKAYVKLKTIVISLFIFLGIARTERLWAQTSFPVGIKKSFVSGDSKKLANYFDRNIELLLLNKGDVYSKAQAELIMKNFFIKYTPESFVIESENKDDISKFAIALLSTKQVDFRVFIAYRRTYINQMIISELSKPDD